MAEGPQVLRTTEWLDRHLAGRKVIRCESNRDDVPADLLVGTTIKRAFCKGKNIFIHFGAERFLHNHLLMRGKWKKLDGQQLFLPNDAWLGLYVGPYTICNLNGQKLTWVNPHTVDEQLAALGPDAMSQPYPADKIRPRLQESTLPISEALLDQSLLAGVGNIAKSEILFSARLDPRLTGNELKDPQLDRLLDAIHCVLWNSYKVGGRWDCRIYRRDGKSCMQCKTIIRSMSLRPSRRATYYCPKCQSTLDR